MRLRPAAGPGTGRSSRHDNAVTTIADGRLAGLPPVPDRDPAVDEFLTAVAEETGYTFDLDSPDLDGATPVARSRGSSAPPCATPRTRPCSRPATRANVITGDPLGAVIDCRVIPGRRAAFEREVDEIIAGCHPRVGHRNCLLYETEFRRRTGRGDERRAAGRRPRVPTVPYMLSGGTDAKHFCLTCIRCFGFIPTWLPPELEFRRALFHGVYERAPADALEFGARCLSVS